jgi:hypothetical protein
METIMKTLIAALALVTIVSAPALARSMYSGDYGYSYHCGPVQYDTSGAPVAARCR